MTEPEADSKTEDKQTENTTDPNPDKEPTFTQADLDKIAGKARAEAKAQADKEHAKALADAKHEFEMSKMSEAERDKAEREKRDKELTERAEQAERSVHTLEAERELAKNGISLELSQYVIGNNTEETVKNVKTLRDQIDAEVKKKVAEGMAHGAPPASTGSKKTTDDSQSALFRGAGIKK